MKKNLTNKGFTLVEIIGVIILLGAIAMITIPSVEKYSEKAKKRTYEANEAKILEAAKNYHIKYPTELEFSEVSVDKIRIEDLKNSEFLSSDAIIDPYTGEEMTDCVAVITYTIFGYNGPSFEYDYQLGCDNIKYRNSHSHGD